MTSSSGRPTRGTRHSSPTSSSASTTRATSTRTCTQASTASAAKRSRRSRSSSTGSARCTTPSPSGSRRRTGSSGSRHYQERLLALYDERPDFVLPGFRYNEARSFIASGLQDFSISRAGQPWGVSIPWDPEQVAYVWADALVNYLSALTYARPGEDLRDRYWPSVRHLIGKDIIRFHCVFWPAMLLSAGYEVPHQIFVHGYLLLDDRKISKSLGNVVDPLDLVDVYGADPVRFWATRAVAFGQDGTVSLESLHERYERELANDLGNLVSRTTAMIDRFLGGELPESPREDSPVAALVEGLADDVARRFDAFDLTGALERIWVVVRGLNRHVESQAPWQLAKEDKRDELQATLYDLADGIRVVAIALASYVPDTSARILEALGENADEIGWERVAYGLSRCEVRYRARGTSVPAHRLADRHGVTDSHAHLDACEEDASALVERAREAGVTRIVTIGTGIDSCRAALRDRRGARGRASRRSGSIRIRPRRRRRAGSTSSASCSRIRRRSRSARPGSTRFVGTRRPPSSAGCSTRTSSSRRSSSFPIVIHNREADAETASALAPFRGTVVLHCFSSAELAPVAVERGYYVSFAGNVTYPNAAALRVGRNRDRARSHPRRDGQPVPRAAAAPWTAERAGERRPHASASWPRRVASPSTTLPRRPTRTPPPPSRSRERRPQEGAGPALPRRREHPRRHRSPCASSMPTTSSSRSGRVSAFSPATSPIACASVHAVELDRSLEPVLRDALGERDERPARLGRRTRPRHPDSPTRTHEARRQPSLQHRDAARRRDARARRVAPAAGA